MKCRCPITVPTTIATALQPEIALQFIAWMPLVVADCAGSFIHLLVTLDHDAAYRHEVLTLTDHTHHSRRWECIGRT